MSVPTPHIAAKKEDVAKTVLMPGDPLRAKFIAETFLEGATLINDVRGALGFTGKYKGVPVSVMASGMGVPSIGIYSYELFNFYDVDNIIRVGSAGTIRPDICPLRSIVAGMAASTDSGFAWQYELPGTYSACADFNLLYMAKEAAGELSIDMSVGNILTTDVFYESKDVLKKWAQMGVMAVEMEAAALYMNAARAGKGALAICTVSDDIFNNEGISVEERQLGFSNMIRIALEAAYKAAKI